MKSTGKVIVYDSDLVTIWKYRGERRAKGKRLPKGHPARKYPHVVQVLKEAGPVAATWEIMAIHKVGYEAARAELKRIGG